MMGQGQGEKRPHRGGSRSKHEVAYLCRLYENHTGERRIGCDSKLSNCCSIVFVSAVYKLMRQEVVGNGYSAHFPTKPQVAFVDVC